MVRRGEIHWADLGEGQGSRRSKRRPVLVVQADAYNASNLNTVLAAVITSNTGVAAMPGNVFLPSAAVGLPRDSVVNVTALVTLNKDDLIEHAGDVPSVLMGDIGRGLRRVLDL